MPITSRAIQLDPQSFDTSLETLTALLDPAKDLEKTASGIGLSLTLDQGTYVFTTAQVSTPPSAGDDIVNKTYADSLVNGLGWKDPVIAASTADVSIASAPAAIDGVTLTSGDRILLKDQATASQNGIWVFNGTGAALTRPADFANAATGVDSSAVLVEQGTVNGDTGYTLSSDSVTVDTTNQTWTQFFGGSVFTFSNGLTNTTGTITVNPDNTTGGDTAPVTVGANGVGVDVTSLNGDHLTVDFTPSNYTPDATPAEAADVDDLAAHLQGVDTAIGTAGYKHAEFTLTALTAASRTVPHSVTIANLNDAWITTDVGHNVMQGEGGLTLTATDITWAAGVAGDGTLGRLVNGDTIHLFYK